jgi:hypothetical protein
MPGDDEADILLITPRGGVRRMNQTKLHTYGALLFLLMFLTHAYLIHKRFREKNVWNNLVKKYKDNTYQKILSEAKFVNKFGAIENKSLLYKLDRLVLTSGVKSVLPWMNGELLLIGMVLMTLAGFMEGYYV